MFFLQITDTFKGFNNSVLDKHDVFSIKIKLKDENGS